MITRNQQGPCSRGFCRRTGPQSRRCLGWGESRYYRRITALLRTAGWRVGKDRVQRIWRREGLKVPQKQRPRARLWLNDGSCVRLRPVRPIHVWSYDFASAITHDGRALRILTLIDEYTRECLAIRVARRLASLEVIETLADVMAAARSSRSTFGRTMVQNFWRRSCANGWVSSGREHFTSNAEARGRTATARASTESCGMNA